MGLLEQSIDYLVEPAILLGNGINQCADNFPNWKDLLVQIGGVNINSKGLTNTELFDFIEFKKSDANKLKSKVVKQFDNVNEINSKVYIDFLELVRRKQCPVLTTNFDFALEKVGELKSYRTNKTSFSRYYPWDTYFGNEQLNLPTDGFGVWHIHGMMKYHDSIRLGLTDYMGSVQKARKLINEGKDQNNWEGKTSWLYIWFNKPLIIVGLGLSSDEVFIRWLLIEREKFFLKFKERRKQTIFISTKRNQKVKNFLNNLNIERRMTSDYNLLYC